MSNFLKRAYDRYETEVESDKYSTTQRLLAAAALLGVIGGGLAVGDRFDLGKRATETIADILGHEGEIAFYED